MTEADRRRGAALPGAILIHLAVLIAFGLLTALVALDGELAASEQPGADPAGVRQAAADARAVAQIYFGADGVERRSAGATASDDLSDIAATLDLFKAAIRSAEAQRLLADRTLPDVWTDLSEARSEADALALSLTAVEGLLEDAGDGAGDGDPAAAVAALVERNRELRIRNLRLVGQLANLERRSDTLGKPPCWVSPDGRPEYTYKITITDLDFMVEPIWRRDRADEIEQIGATTSRETMRYDDEAFSRAMYPFLAYGAESEPECRFFVQVVDATGPFKGAWQERLALVEGYFYKYWLK